MLDNLKQHLNLLSKLKIKLTISKPELKNMPISVQIPKKIFSVAECIIQSK